MKLLAKRLRRQIPQGAARLYQGAQIARTLANTDHPLLAQLVVCRRCNLTCSYCNEYDRVSDPVPHDEIIRRIDRLAALRTRIVTLTGGEPMLHPRIEDQIAALRERNMIAGMITNGYFLQPERIKGLNEAGLQHMQLSIDNLDPDSVSVKSWKLLVKKLRNLAEQAKFAVNINVVLGSGTKTPEDCLTIAEGAKKLGFSCTVGIIHDGNGQLVPLGKTERSVYDRVVALAGGTYSQIQGFQRNLVDGTPNDWRCRAGARYLYICEDGLVHFCSQQRGLPGIPLMDYGVEHIRQAFRTQKSCAPTCTIGCVHRASWVDSWRAQPDPDPNRADSVEEPREASAKTYATR